MQLQQEGNSIAQNSPYDASIFENRTNYIRQKKTKPVKSFDSFTK